jgi:glycine hydroxymethyltransferase
VKEFKDIGGLITEVLDGLAKHGEQGNGKVETAVRTKVAQLTRRFPIYS